MVETSTDPSPKIEANFAAWMRAVVDQHAAASRALEADPVHDLRVALRRCLLVAEVFERLDPDPTWRELRKHGHRVFKRLGRLRDTQVLCEWVTRIAPQESPIAAALRRQLEERETEDRERAREALRRFSRRRWKQCGDRLSNRVTCLPAEGPAAEYLAVERWEQAYALHRRAIRSGTHASFHRARIALKEFRYTAEIFLPVRSAPWMAKLKKLQDALGEAHDLGLLLAMLRSFGKVGSASERRRSNRAVARLAAARFDAYRRMTRRGAQARCGSAWRAWREELPRGADLEAAGMAWLELWASFLTPDPAHAKRVTRLALQLYDQLAAAHLGGAQGNGHTRRVLEIAALAHDVGRAEGARSHHKRSYRLISKLEVPLGWTPEEMHLAALVARYHRRALPQARHAEFRRLPHDRRQKVLLLAGILRLANALASDRDASVEALKARIEPDRIAIHAGGYRGAEPFASRVAEARRLFEIATRRPVAVLPAPA